MISCLRRTATSPRVAEEASQIARAYGVRLLHPGRVGHAADVIVRVVEDVGAPNSMELTILSARC